MKTQMVLLALKKLKNQSPSRNLNHSDIHINYAFHVVQATNNPANNPRARKQKATTFSTQDNLPKTMKLEVKDNKIVVSWALNNFDLACFKRGTNHAICQNVNEWLACHTEDLKEHGAIEWQVAIKNGATGCLPKGKMKTCTLVQEDPKVVAQNEMAFKQLKAHHAPNNNSGKPSREPTAGVSFAAQGPSNLQAPLAPNTPELVTKTGLLAESNGSPNIRDRMVAEYLNQQLRLAAPPPQLNLFASHLPQIQVLFPAALLQPDHQFNQEELFQQFAPYPQAFPGQPLVFPGQPSLFPGQTPGFPRPLLPPMPSFPGQAWPGQAFPGQAFPGQLYKQAFPQQQNTNFAHEQLPDTVHHEPNQPNPAPIESSPTPSNHGAAIDDFIKFAQLGPSSTLVINGLSHLGITHWSLLQHILVEALINVGIPLAQAQAIMFTFRRNS
ncbi:hypothetical protein PSTG_07968 [Puccinia striiformis f. sp. tritici PST-78]|uniref:Uncharacterized protein n=1 Tax=Puccinia striiformis f. sp. tritici PST-78 TaxID=1165861 RepID=A0A0L0VHS9_9BASI|nr:hypothetical protein PSTG_07968 [Puccinia striiformis f. sp. tritici PST-78]